MGWMRAAWDWFTVADATSATFSLEGESPPRPTDQLLLELWNRGEAGGAISRERALSVPAVLKGRNIICGIATLPLVEQDGDLRPVASPFLRQIDRDVPNVVTIAQTCEDLFFEAIAWWKITEQDGDQFPVHARRLDPSTVSLHPPSDRSPAPLPSGEEPRGASVWVDGVETPAARVIRFDSPNPGVLKVAARTVRRAQLLDQAAAMYAEDPRPLDYFTPAEDADPVTDEEAADLIKKWMRARRKRATAYVPAALKYETPDQPTPADLQLVDLQRQVTLDLANALGLDPEDLGVSTTSRTYQNATDRRQDRINETLSPYIRALTDRLSMGDVTRDGHQVTVKLDEYMRADPRTRWEVNEIATRIGATDREEIREREGWAPRPPAAAPAPPAAAAGDVSRETSPPAPAARRAGDALAAAGLSVWGGADLQLTDDGAGWTFAGAVTGFAVDTAQRTITGLVLPYGQAAAKLGRRWRFAPGSVEWPADISRVKLLRDHVYAAAVGRALSITDGPAGLTAVFRVAAGPDGDRSLSLAEERVVDGLSVGVDILDAVPDPENRGVMLVRRALLREVSLTAVPAFDDSRVTSVAAHRDGGIPMSHPIAPAAAGDQSTGQPVALHMTGQGQGQPATQGQGQPATQGQPAGATFSAEQLGAMFAASPTLLAQLLGGGAPAATPPAPAPRQVVDPTHGAAGAAGGRVEVTEPAPYRFDADGNLAMGSHDFSTDLIAWDKQRDQAAYDRATAWVSAQFDVNSGNVSALNPTRNRPDLYVDQREFRYPMWAAINKGNLGDITPFTFPKFNTAAGLVNNHTEGVEPGSGTLTSTSQTVTPTGISGKAKITREVWDQGGNPQVSGLIWRQMQRGWFESLEAFAVSVLDAATPTGITLPVAAVNAALDAALVSALARLQFVRGGFSMDNLFTQVDLFMALVGAVDSTGRRLYPPLGPSNASGTSRARWSALDLNGVTALPAWALAATGVVPASSYLFDSESVHGWASAPQRIDIDRTEVAHVYIGLWGYKAGAISDINGVREIIYDPA